MPWLLATCSLRHRSINRNNIGIKETGMYLFESESQVVVEIQVEPNETNHFISQH